VDRVLGGSCFISTKLDEGGQILHVSDIHRLTFGERAGGRSERVDALAAAMASVKFEAVASEEISRVMWDKWVFLATLAGLTCLARASIGDIVSAGGADLAAALLDECRAIAAAAGYPPRADALNVSLARLTDPGSSMSAAPWREGGRDPSGRSCSKASVVQSTL
jgi:2-dehydropantoate 2-reductase